MVTETFQEKETYELGRRLGEEARAGQVYTLIGDLGVGKTVFTKGLAAGLGITEPVSSPTFTIVQEYEEGRLPFYHFDVYRIGDVEEMVARQHSHPVALHEHLQADSTLHLLFNPCGERLVVRSGSFRSLLKIDLPVGRRIRRR